MPSWWVMLGPEHEFPGTRGGYRRSIRHLRVKPTGGWDESASCVANRIISIQYFVTMQISLNRNLSGCYMLYCNKYPMMRLLFNF